jgi:hypothetical protein
MSYKLEAEILLIDIRYAFHEINADEQLTEADKKQVKEFYLQHMIAPNARKLLEKYFPEEFGKKPPVPPSPGSKPRPHQDR